MPRRWCAWCIPDSFSNMDRVNGVLRYWSMSRGSMVRFQVM